MLLTIYIRKNKTLFHPLYAFCSVFNGAHCSYTIKWNFVSATLCFLCCIKCCLLFIPGKEKNFALATLCFLYCNKCCSLFISEKKKNCFVGFMLSVLFLMVLTIHNIHIQHSYTIKNNFFRPHYIFSTVINVADYLHPKK